MSKKSKYPTLVRTLAIMSNDSGPFTVQLADCENLKLDEERYQGTVNLATVETFLAGLTKDQLEQFAIGDLEEEAFVPVWSTPEGLMANAFLEYVFNQAG